MVNDATEIELRAEREMGKLIQQKQEAGELAKREDNLKKGPEVTHKDFGEILTLSKIESIFLL